MADRVTRTGRLEDAARAAGWTITLRKGGHSQWRSPGGAIVTVSTSPSDRRAWRNTRARLRRAGLDC